MTTKEIMIGDWVIGITPNGSHDVIKISTIDKVSIVDTDRHSWGVDTLIPIPLTEEILKANGFEKVIGYDYYYHIPAMWGIVITINNEMIISHWEDHNDNVYVEFGCTYVHQVQHIMRLYGLTDMADNFKVE